jgi:hypothetical protein
MIILAGIAGIVIGAAIAYLLSIILQHKSDISYEINVIKSDIAAFHVKLDKIISSITPQ